MTTTRLSRRAWLAGGSGLLLAPWLAANSFASDEMDPGYDDFFSFELPDDTRPQGVQPALDEEEAEARRIMQAAPRGSTPRDVLVYFAGLTTTNRDGHAYNAGWPTRWNPVIVNFFTQTRTRPSGDTTPWCAACLNWALMHAGYRGTNSASSGSFRNAPGLGQRGAVADLIERARTDSPVPGDIAVWRETDVERARLGRGHVGIFLARETRNGQNGIVVLGGNQGRQRSGHSRIRESFFPDEQPSLVFDRYLSIAAMRA